VDGCRYLDLSDYLLIAEALLGRPAEELARVAQLHLAESALSAPAAAYGGVEFYPEFEVKAAVLCARIIKNHALPDGNKRVGYVALLEFIRRNGYTWNPPNGNPDATVEMMEGVAASVVSEEELTQWIKERLA
jgi:death on curing protein